MKTSRNDDSEENSIKIILIGLDNGGKTSILTSLSGIKNISAFSSLKPTIGENWENFKALDTNYLIFDLGGQKSFHNDYFKNLQRYLAGTKKIIFVFDIQDVNRYSEALNYLERLIKSMNGNNGIEFSIFLHKYDPDIKFNKELNEKIINDLITQIKEKIPLEFEYSLYKTSIYAIFEKSAIS